MTDRTISKLLLREDWKFLNQQLQKFDPEQRKYVKQEYKREFLAGMDKEPKPHKKSNAGRRRANLHLLKLTEHSHELPRI